MTIRFFADDFGEALASEIIDGIGYTFPLRHPGCLDCRRAPENTTAERKRQGLRQRHDRPRRRLFADGDCRLVDGRDFRLVKRLIASAAFALLALFVVCRYMNGDGEGACQSQ